MALEDLPEAYKQAFEPYREKMHALADQSERESCYWDNTAALCLKSADYWDYSAQLFREAVRKAEQWQ
jgi:hypothetical protein